MVEEFLTSTVSCCHSKTRLFAGNPKYPELRKCDIIRTSCAKLFVSPSHMRNNASGVDNQQESLISLSHWIRGFVDGEGCFSIGFVAQPETLDPKRPFGRRKAYKTGYQVAHTFAVVQGARSLSVLELIKDFFKVGNIYRNRRHDNHKEDLFKYEVTKRDDLLQVIIPFFKKFPLLTAKQRDFKSFATVLEMMATKQHLTFEGLVAIATIAQDMNHRKPRKTLIRILRDYTPGNLARSTKLLLH